MQIANPVSFLVQKILIHGRRSRDQRAKDILYMYDTIETFATRIAELRHFGTYVLQKTGNIAAVMNSMGHSDVKAAMTYQHPEMNVVRDAINSRHILRHSFSHARSGSVS